MSQARPWEREWKVEDPDFGHGGQGTTLDLCGTVAAAHRERVLHRDLKPANIIVRNFEKADLVIVDYGLSFNETENEGEHLTDEDERIANQFISLDEMTAPGGDKRDPR